MPTSPALDNALTTGISSSFVTNTSRTTSLTGDAETSGYEVEKMEEENSNIVLSSLAVLPRISLRDSDSTTIIEKEDEKSEKVGIIGKHIGITRRQLQIVLSFLLIWLVGLTNESATGANLNAMQVYYNVDYEKISLVFLANILGYLISCLLSSFLTHHYSFSTSLLLAGILQALGSLTLALAPPFPVFVSAVALLGFGSGLFDACLAMVMSHEEDAVLMSTYYSALAFGGAIGPFVVSGLAERDCQWNIFYYIPMALTIVLSGIAYPIFSKYQPPPDEVFEDDEEVTVVAVDGGVPDKKVMGVKARMVRSLKMKIVWIGFALCFLSFGFTDTISAWIVSYLVIERGEVESFSRYQLAAIWAGIGFGRIFFAFTGKRLSEKIYCILLLLATSGFLAILWAVNQQVVGFVSLIAIGFFIGPVTPRSLSMLSEHVTPSIRGSVISMAVASGLAGACIMPLLFGVVAQQIKNGIITLPAVLLGSCVIMIGIWLAVPKNQKEGSKGLELEVKIE